MSPVARIKDIPSPEDLHGVPEIKEYLKRLHEALQEEQSERIEDFDWLKIDNKPVIDVREYGARGDKTVDDTVAIKAAITACENLYIESKYYSRHIPAVTLDFGTGDYKITSALTISSPMNITGQGARIYQFGNAHGLIFDGGTGAGYRNVRFSGVAVEKETRDTGTTYVGIWLKGVLRAFDMSIPQITNFGKGVMLGDPAVESSNAYHRIYLGGILKCNQPIVLWAGADSGWCNANSFYAGTIDVAGADGNNFKGVYLDGTSGNAGYPGCNRFYGLTIEGTISSNVANARTLYIRGDRNIFDGLYIEQTDGAENIEFHNDTTYNVVEVCSSSYHTTPSELLVGSLGSNTIKCQRYNREILYRKTIGIEGHTSGANYSPGLSMYPTDFKHSIFGWSLDSSVKPLNWHRANRATYYHHVGGALHPGGQILSNGVMRSVRKGQPISIEGTIDIGVDATSMTFSSDCFLLPGDHIIVIGAGAAGADLSTIVTEVSTNGQTVTIDDDAETSVTDNQVIHEAYTNDWIIYFAGESRAAWVCITASTSSADAVYGEIDISLEGSDTWNPGSIADGDEEAKEVTVTGAALGDFAIASMSIDVTDLVLNAQVTGTNTVTCILANNTGDAIDLGSGTIYVKVIKK